MGSLEEKFISVCDEYLSKHGGYDIRGERGLFSFAMVVWLGIQQRLTGNSLREALKELITRAEASRGVEFLVARLNQKILGKSFSLSTGGVSRARDRYSAGAVKELFYAAAHQIRATQKNTRSVYVLDGQNVTISRSESNLAHFAPTGNGEGELHFPRIRVVSAHELDTGIAREVAVGDWKDSEVSLSKDVTKKLPPGSLIVMDRGFARPGFVHAIAADGCHVLVRLNDAHGEKLLRQGTHVTWHAKRAACEAPITVTGRVIHVASEVKGFRSQEFYFFTTDASLSDEEVAALYRQRVQVEVFIRDLKQTLKMAFIRSKKGDNVEKEILISYLTFNLVRAVMTDAAETLGIPVTRMSFTGTIACISAYAAAFVNAKNSQEIDDLKKRFYQSIYQTKLPLRSKERSYPRVVRMTRDKYDTAGIVRKSRPAQVGDR